MKYNIEKSKHIEEMFSFLFDDMFYDKLLEYSIERYNKDQDFRVNEIGLDREYPERVEVSGVNFKKLPNQNYFCNILKDLEYSLKGNTPNSISCETKMIGGALGLMLASFIALTKKLNTIYRFSFDISDDDFVYPIYVGVHLGFKSKNVFIKEVKNEIRIYYTQKRYFLVNKLLENRIEDYIESIEVTINKKYYLIEPKELT